MISVPITVHSLINDSFEVYSKEMKKQGVGRIFLYGVGYPYDDTFIFKNSKKLSVLKQAIKKFKSDGFEVGIWVTGFGHSDVLYSGNVEKIKRKYRPIVSVDGKTAIHVPCPRDDRLRWDYFEGLRALARLSPDIMMIDDDFCLNDRQGNSFGCFCYACKARLDGLVGEKLPQEELERLIFTDGKNKYRDAYNDVSRETLMSFARDAGEAISQVDGRIRFATCRARSCFVIQATDIDTNSSKVIIESDIPAYGYAAYEVK